MSMRSPILFAILSALCAASAVAEVRIERKNVRNGTVDVPVEVAIPGGKGPFPAVLYVHARRGYEDPDRAHTDGPNMVPHVEMRALLAQLQAFDRIAKAG